jgi:hypothetical protein
MSEPPRWWEARRAQSRKPASYRCPLCGEYLPALTEHMLLFPEGDHSRRRHAHTQCVIDARRQGRLPTRDEYQRAKKRGAAEAAPHNQPPTGLRRLLARLRP